MSGDFIYAAEEFPLKNAASGKIEKGLKRLLIVAGIILGAELVWLFVISPCIPLSTVEVRGFAGFDGAAVLGLAGIREGASFVSVNAKETEKVLAAHYLVESARVIKRFPDRLSVFLEPRKAVALSLAKVQGRLLPVYYDRHGVVFRIGGGETENLPLVSGLVLENPVLGMKLPAAFGPLLVEIARIGENAPELLEAVSEIRINRKAFNGFDLVLYPVHYPIQVRLGDNFNEETLRYVMLMLDVLKSGNSFPGEIDFRSGIGSYKVKEARSGE
ncbi:MAG: FtsQ-type POTRA domain-containing protein [Treponema sp.]|jgi:cell division protein FtsQ|nr:FtsQ-type POTRA domain-containing protein [Treponema sp.]